MYSGFRSPLGSPSMKQNSQRLAQRRIVGGASSSRALASGRSISHDLLARREPHRDLQLVVRRHELPIEKVLDLAPVHGDDLRAGHDLEFLGDAVGSHACDANHA
jgi:uncharacterized protein involved in type VI secretion and phage assembly